MNYLKRQVTDLRKSNELAQLDRADTINRLTQSVEQSQRQCQQLLEAGKVLFCYFYAYTVVF